MSSPQRGCQTRHGMNPSEEVRDSGQYVVNATESSLEEALNGFIGKFVGWPFTAAPGFLIDAYGSRTDVFASVVHTTPAKAEGREAGGFPVDGVAAVIDVSDNLGIENLR